LSFWSRNFRRKLQKKASRRDDISKSDRDAKLRKIENETSAITQQIKDQAKQLENATAATKKLESVKCAGHRVLATDSRARAVQWTAAKWRELEFCFNI